MTVPKEKEVKDAMTIIHRALEEAKGHDEIKVRELQAALNGMYNVLDLMYGEKEASRVYTAVIPRTPEPVETPPEKLKS